MSTNDTGVFNAEADKLIKPAMAKVLADIANLHDEALLKQKLEKSTVDVFKGVQDMLLSLEKILAVPAHAAYFKIKVKEAYNSANPDSDSVARKRVTLIESCRCVAYGGTKDKITVSGSGWKTVAEIVKKAKTINELNALLSAAKPEALKQKKADKAEESSEPVIIDRFEAAKLAHDAIVQYASFLSDSKADKALSKVLEGVITTLASDVQKPDSLLDTLKKAVNQ